MARGPSLSGPLGTGWTAAALAPKTTNLPVSQAAAARYVTPPGWGNVPTTPAGQQKTAAMHAERLAKLKPEADALEKAGDQASLQKALDLRKQIAVLEAYGDPNRPKSLDLYKKTVSDFKTAHPDYKLTGREEFGLDLNLSGSADAPSLQEAVLGTPTAANFSPPAAAAASSGGNLSQYDLTDADFGAGLGPDPRAVKPKGTPLESLLAAIYPDMAAGPGADPFADPRAPTSGNSVFQNVLAGLGQRGASQGWVSGGPSISGPAMVGPSAGANLAATIPGAPPFLAGAINNVSGNGFVGGGGGFVPAQVGGGFDPLIGLSAISAEQRIQAAQLAKDKAAAQAKWFASQAKQEQTKAEQANMSRLKGFSGSGFTPAMPTY